MSDLLKALLIVVGIAVTLAAVVTGVNLLGFTNFAFFTPKVEQVRYNTFKQSQAYNDGMLRDLQELKMQYIQANPEQQAMLKSIVLHRFSVYDINRLPSDLQTFYHTINTGV